jgi:hypothetical protein
MKTLITALVMLLFAACKPMGEIQATAEIVTLVKIDTVGRYDHSIKVLTYETEKGVQIYVQANMDDVFMLGQRVPLLIQKW